MADATDSKSVIRKGVRVQVPLPTPNDPMAEWFMRSSAKAVMLVRFQLGSPFMVVVAQQVRALDCGSRGRWFESTQLPQNKEVNVFQNNR